jgi:anaerobic ribonucleoside-triphosphate reductase
MKQDQEMRAGKCTQRVETFSRCVGFFRPVQTWNPGKRAEFEARKEIVLNEGNKKTN